MELIYKIPKLVRFLVIGVLANLLICTIMRVIFYAVFRTSSDVIIPYPLIVKAFYMGLRFDLRLVLIAYFPILLFGWIKPVYMFKKFSWKNIWLFYSLFVFKLLLLLYIIDFFYYDYLETRMDATILRFAYNPLISLNMILESYPIFRLILLFIIIVGLYWYGLRFIFIKIYNSNSLNFGKKWKKALFVFIFAICYLFGIYGKFELYPLRWSEAFFSTNTFVSSLTLNPILFFYDTFKNKEAKYDVKKVKKYYDMMADYLGVEKKDKENLNFVRAVDFPKKSDKPNVVIFLLESFAYYKTGISGNPLNPSPNFDELANHGLLFKRYYTPHGGTARSVFTAVTGIPDIELVETSSRNPLIVDQHTIIDDFKDYDKYYFLGGSANWGEIRGLLLHNIKGLKLFEEGSYSSPNIDVWGISDLDLFKEANSVFKKKKEKPFFAIIHTSGNHRPYTIPKDNDNFEIKEISKEKAVKYGFRSPAAFNSYRFMDHSIGIFMKLAKKEDYFKNTVFVFIGDHGLYRNADHMHPSEKKLLLNKYHVPLSIYAPWLIKSGRHYDKVVSEVDLLPTIASLISESYINSTFGRNLLNEKDYAPNYAFTILHKGNPEIGLIGNEFYFLMNGDGANKRLHKIYSDKPEENVINEFPDTADKMERLLGGIYETAKYIRYHNSSERVNELYKTYYKKAD